MFAADICHDGIAALPAGAPVLNGLAVRPWTDATASVAAPLLTVAGFGDTVSGVEFVLLFVVFGVDPFIDVGGAEPMPPGIVRP